MVLILIVFLDHWSKSFQASLTRNRFWWKSFSIKFVSKWPWKNEILLCWGQFPGLQHYIPLPTTFPKRRTGLENDAETFSMLCLALSLCRPQNLKDSPRLLSTSLYTLLVRKYEAASVDIFAHYSYHHLYFPLFIHETQELAKWPTQPCWSHPTIDLLLPTRKKVEKSIRVNSISRTTLRILA